MSLIPDLYSISLRPLLGGLVQKANLAAATHGLTAASAVTNYLVKRFTDSSRQLPDALHRAAEKSWHAVEVALAGESWWSLLTSTAEQKAMRDQIRVFLNGNPLQLPPEKSEGLRKVALAQLREARKKKLIPGSDTSPKEIVERTLDFGRFSDTAAILDAEWQGVARMVNWLRSQQYSALADILSVRTNGSELPLIIVSMRYFFRREVETNPQLFQGIAYQQLEQMSEGLKVGFSHLGNLLQHQSAMLESLLAQFANILENTIDIKNEQARQGKDLQDMYAEIVRVSEKLDKLHERPLRSSDSLSIRNDSEREMIKKIVGQYRSLPDSRRQQLPAMLDALARLELAAGEPEAACSDFQKVAKMIPDAKSAAAVHYRAYQSALETGNWKIAFRELVQAINFGKLAFAPFDVRKYTPTRILGAGGFGVAFLCTHRELGTEVVVKTLLTEDLDRQIEDVFNEARTLDRLEHPNIIRLRDCAYTDPIKKERPYFVMNMFNGLGLDSHVNQSGAILVNEIRLLARPIAEGLQAAHNNGILHRDVKPGNILVRRSDSGEWSVKLIDFGLAIQKKVLDGAISSSSSGKTLRGTSIAGTIDYAAPEQMGKIPAAKIGPRSDIYGFGKTLCYALFQTPQPSFLHWKSLADEPLALLISACIHDNPDDRPSSFAEVLERLQPFNAIRAVDEKIVPTSVPAVFPKTEQSIAKTTTSESPELGKDLEEFIGVMHDHALTLDFLQRRLSTHSEAWHDAAHSGSAIAQCLMGWCYLKGAGVAKDEGSAFRYFKRSANSGLALAQCSLGWVIHSGLGTTQDLPEGIKWYRIAADQGLPMANFLLGAAFETGSGVEKNIAEAERSYQAAAESGCALAMNALGDFYSNQNDKVKKAKAIEWHTLAAEKGLPIAQWNLGRDLEMNTDQTDRFSRAMDWYRKAAEQGLVFAQVSLGRMYEDGEGVEKNFEEAVRWFQSGTLIEPELNPHWYRQNELEDHAVAERALAIMYYDGKGCEVDVSAGARLLEKSSEKGDAPSTFMLAKAFEATDLGVRRDKAKALELLRLAAERGYDEAQFQYGIRCEKGTGIPKDHVQAAQWYRKAADQGHLLAHSHLGTLYEFGYGVNRDLNEAVRLYRIAADGGEAEGEANLGLLFKKSGPLKNHKEALKWLLKAARHGDADGQNALGEMYEKGYGTDIDLTKAIHWYRRAARKGQSAGQRNYNRLSQTMPTVEETATDEVDREPAHEE